MKRILFLVLMLLTNASCVNQKNTLNENYVQSPIARNPSSLETDLSTNTLLTEAKDKLALAEKYLQSLEGLSVKPTVENTLIPYNDILILVDEAAANAHLVSNLDTRSERRDEARDLEKQIDNFANQRLGLNPKVYNLIKAINPKSFDAETRYFITKTLREFRRAGVDKDEKTRKRIAGLWEELTNEVLKFQKNIADDQRKYIVTDPKELAGLPQDFLDNHKPNAQGEITITTQYPDIFPIFEYATDIEFRKKIYLLFNGRGYPQNEEVLRNILKLRYELANLLGYKNWAQYNQETKMLNTPEKVRGFINQMIQATARRGKLDYQELLNQKRKMDPKALEVFDYEKGLFTRLLKMEKLNFDSNQLRQYFSFENVKKGVFEITSRLFKLTYQKVHGLTLWHEDVEAYDVYEGSKYIGRFYLDLFPREGKYSHAAHMTFRIGRKNGAIPQGILMCNFPNPKTQNPALLSHADFETFLHEFGHLLHSLLAGHHQWQMTSGHGVEWDFIEAPSQFLEEWSKDYDTLASFARHYKTGEVIPRDLVVKLNLASRFNQGIYVRTQMFYSDLSFTLFNGKPPQGPFDDVTQKLQNQINFFRFVPGSHFVYNFGHLMGYSSSYYTYMWSLVMAKDMFSLFQKNGLYDPETARRYKQEILEVGATRPAEKSLEAFLKRKLSYKPFTQWLNNKD